MKDWLLHVLRIKKWAPKPTTILKAAGADEPTVIIVCSAETREKQRLEAIRRGIPTLPAAFEALDRK